MEPYIILMNTRYSLDSSSFTDDLMYDDNYMVSFNVSTTNIAETSRALDFLFEVPFVSGLPNIANLSAWEFTYYDSKGRLCYIEKNGETIYFSNPHIRLISTDVSSGIAYLRGFRDRVNMLIQNMPSSTPTTQVAELD